MSRLSLFRFIIGDAEFIADIRDGASLLNAFMEYGIQYRDFHGGEDDTVSFKCSSYSALAVDRVCRKKNIAIKKVREVGIPPVIYRYRNRIGLFLGAIFAIIMIALSDNYIWDIQVSGNESVTYSRVVEALAEQGMTVGSKIDGLDVDKVKTAVMVDSDTISWMSINIIGTVAHVQIREVKQPEPETPLRPANVVASMDGQIEYLEVFQGDAAVRSGEAVKKGDVLISGVRDSKLGGFSVTRANGKVFAVTSHTFSVEIPYEYEKKIYGKAKKSEISVIFFGKEIKVFKYSGNEGVFCDTIESVDMLRLYGNVKVPIGIRTLNSVECETTTETRTPEEAMEIAYYRLERQIAASLPDAQILQKDIRGEIGDDSYVLTCTVKCIENIAETVEFEADLTT